MKIKILLLLTSTILGGTHSDILTEIRDNWMRPKTAVDSGDVDGPPWNLPDFGFLAEGYQGPNFREVYKGMAIGDAEALEIYRAIYGRPEWLYLGKRPEIRSERTEKLITKFIPGVGWCFVRFESNTKTTATFAPLPIRRVRQPVEVEPPPPIAVPNDKSLRADQLLRIEAEIQNDPNNSAPLKALLDLMAKEQGNEN